jgi:hypothetical protein
MSEIFSFRLSKSNPREARAMELLQAKTSEGISLRQVITDGLLALANRPSETNIYGGEKIQTMLGLVLDLLQKGSQKTGIFDVNGNKQSEINALSEQFTNSLKREVKKGLQVQK